MIQQIPEILDATAGNRTIYKTKDDPRILYIDIEPDLTVQPDMVLDCRNTGFPDKSFHTIIFDPPHEFGHTKNKGMMSTPNRRDVKPEWEAKSWGKTRPPRYYGGDKYQTLRELIVFIRKATIEFNRILTDDGIVLLKWGEHFKDVDKIIFWFKEAGFFELMRTCRYDKGPASYGGVWVLLMKRRPEP